MTGPTLDFTIDLTPALSREVCGKHSIRTGISHTGGDWHPYVDLCPWCATAHAESALAIALRRLAEAHEAVAWITGTNDVASVIAGAMVARAAEGGGDG